MTDALQAVRGRPPVIKIKTGPTLVEEAILAGKTERLIIANGTKKVYRPRKIRKDQDNV